MPGHECGCSPENEWCNWLNWECMATEKGGCRCCKFCGAPDSCRCTRYSDMRRNLLRHRAQMRIMRSMMYRYRLYAELCDYVEADGDECCSLSNTDEGSDADDPLKDALDELADRQALIAAITPAAPMLTELARVRLDLERAAMQREDLLSVRL